MLILTKRQLLVGAAGAAVLPGGAHADDLLPHEQALYDAAKKEGELTWYSGQLQAETGEAVGKAFTGRYPGIKVNVVRSTSQVAYQRLSQDMQAGVAQCDMFSSTDYGHYNFLKREGKLLPYRPKNADGMIPAARDPDPDNMFQIFYIGLYLLAYNTKLVSDAEAPKSWKDLLDPRWKGKIAVGHPGYSGAIGVMGVVLSKMYGWDYFTALEKNKPQVDRSADDPVTLMNAGERSVGMGVSLAAPLLSLSRGNPLKIVYPTDGTLAVYSPSAIPKNAPHPNAAKLFMEFASGPGYAEITRKFFIMPLRPEVSPPEGAKPFADVKLIQATPAQIEDGVPEIKEKWRDTFGV
jgi:iron(III) transport system substrate-binding protein